MMEQAKAKMEEAKTYAEMGKEVAKDKMTEMAGKAMSGGHWLDLTIQ